MAEQFNPDKTSGANSPFWTEGVAPLSFETLHAPISTEVLVIGGGIGGLTTAYCLAKSGKKVVLVEDGYLGSGESGRTTAHITYALDDRYYDIERYFGLEKAKIIANSHVEAIDFIEKTVIDENIDCNFRRVDGYLFLDPTDEEESLDDEYESTKRIGLPTEILYDIPDFVGEFRERCILFPGQAQFHILKYLQGLAKAIVKYGGKIYTESRASDIDKQGAKVNGFEVRANHIVVATNTPVNDLFTMHTKQWPYRTYVIGVKVPKGKLPYSMWWDTGNQESKWVAKPYHYVRLEPFNDQFDLLTSGGEDHKTGQADEENLPEEHRFAALMSWTKEHFPYFTDIEYKWSGQVMEPVDCLAFLGKNPGDDSIYIITGDSGNGMTHCTIGGILINDLINGKENSWEEIYSPSRITFKTGGDFMTEIGNMAYKMAKDWVHSDIEKPSELKAGEGAILSKGLKKVALYRDENGALHSCSAVCPHMGGILQWNKEEKSFDCPLHGSRFTTDGIVINGPAGKDLKKITIEDE